MFSHGADSAHDAAAAGGVGVGVSAGGVPALVPARFVWPHGGKTVYLTGSFTRFVRYLSLPLPLSPSFHLPYHIRYLL
jgi:hypothetical protein